MHTNGDVIGQDQKDKVHLHLMKQGCQQRHFVFAVATAIHQSLNGITYIFVLTLGIAVVSIRQRLDEGQRQENGFLL